MDRHPRGPSRRQVVRWAGLGGLMLLAGCGRLPWQAQAPRPPRVARLGWLTGGSPDASSDGLVPNYEQFLQGLRELGYVEGQQFTVEARWAEGQPERLPALAAELVRLPLDVIVTGGTPSTQALKQAAPPVPTVFIAVSDPVGQGFVASLGRPGGSFTGLSDFGVTLVGKRLELLKETVPGTARVAVLRHLGSPAATVEWSAAEDAARLLGLELQALEIHGDGDLPGAFAAAREARADALLLLTGPYTSAHFSQLVGLAASSHLPMMLYRREAVAIGGLMAYGPRYGEMYRRAAAYVDKILRGTAPADLPVEQPMRFDLAVNLQTAQTLGLAFPEAVLIQATEIVR